MAKKIIPLYDFKPCARARKLVDQTLASGWLTTGPRVEEFEKAVASLVGVRYAAAVNSATAGMLLTLTALRPGEASEVITTPFSFVATAEAIIHAGARPVFADILPGTLTIDPEEIARKVGHRTLAIMPVDIAGYPADYEKLKKISTHFGLPLVADAAHSIGSTLLGKSSAKWADAAIYSFHATKNLTCGEGGMVLSRHKTITDRVKLLSRHGMTAGAYKRKQSGKHLYDVSDIGWKANMSDLHAAVGLGQLTVFARDQKRREKIARRYIANLSSLEDFLELPAGRRGVGHSWHLFIVRLHLSRLRIDRDRFIRLMRSSGVECSVHFRPLFELSLFQQLGVNERYYPNAAYAGRRVMSLPMFPDLKLTDVDYICEQILSIVKNHSR